MWPRMMRTRSLQWIKKRKHNLVTPKRYYSNQRHRQVTRPIELIFFQYENTLKNYVKNNEHSLASSLFHNILKRRTKLNVPFDQFLESSFNIFCKKRYYDDITLKIFNDLIKIKQLDDEYWISMFKLLAHKDKHELILSLFQNYKKKEKLHKTVIHYAITSSLKLNILNNFEEYLKLYKNAAGVTPEIYGWICKYFLKKKEYNKVINTIQIMRSKNIPLDSNTFYSLIISCSIAGDKEKMMETVTEMKLGNVPISSKMLDYIISALKKSNDIEGVKMVVKIFNQYDWKIKSTTFIKILDILEKVNDFETTKIYYHMFLNKGIPVNNVMLEKFLKIFSKNMDEKLSTEVFFKIVQYKFKPGLDSISSLFEMHIKKGEAEKAKSIIDYFYDVGFIPTKDMYSKLADCFRKKGNEKISIFYDSLSL